MSYHSLSPLLLLFQLIVARDNGFTYPPHSFTNDGLEGSDIVLIAGEKVTLLWETDYVEPLTIWQYQWKRDRTSEPYTVKLLENTANSPQPKSLSWTAAPVNESDPDWPNQLTHFNALIFNNFGFNSKTIRVVKDQAAAASISRAFSTTASSSTMTSSALPSTQATLAGDVTENKNTSETRTLGIALGIGLGIPLLIVLGGLTMCWFSRRKIIARYLSPVPANGTNPPSKEKEVHNSPGFGAKGKQITEKDRRAGGHLCSLYGYGEQGPVQGSDGLGGHERYEVDAESTTRHEVPG
jgi:hypothetical protein